MAVLLPGLSLGRGLLGKSWASLEREMELRAGSFRQSGETGANKNLAFRELAAASETSIGFPPAPVQSENLPTMTLMRASRLDGEKGEVEAKTELLAGNARKTSALLGIQSAIAEGLPAAYAEPDPAGTAMSLDATISKVRDLLGTVDQGLVLYEPFREPSLSADEYILPEELSAGGRHERWINFLSSDATIPALPFQGVLLHGRTGTGKTEYVRFLQHILTGMKVRFFLASISGIMHSPKPGEALIALYRDLQLQAEEKGEKYILLFDEFEGLVRQFLKRQEKVIREDSYQDHGPKRSSTSTHSENSTVTDVDKTGEELLAALKSVLRGTGGGMDRVFTIATTNESIDVFNEALLGRLEPVEIHTLRIPTIDSSHNHLYLRYQAYGEILPKMLALIQTAHFRQNKEKNSALVKILEEFESLVGKLKGETARISGHEPQRNINEIWLGALLEFFGVREPRRRWDFNTFQIFSFYYTNQPKQVVDFTQLSVTQAYLEEPSKFKKPASAKKRLALLLFPQLARYRDVF
jgi:hypothetical protein